MAIGSFLRKVGGGTANFLVGGIKAFAKKPSLKTGALAVMDVVPAGKFAKIARIGMPALRLAKRGAIGLGTTYKGFQSASLGQKVAKIAKVSAGGGLTYYSVTGQMPAPSLRTTAGIAGFTLSPLGGIIGAIKGAGKEGKDIFNIAKDTFGRSDYRDYIPQVPPIEQPQLPFMDTPMYSGGDTILNFPAGSAGGISGLGTPSIDVNLGGGIGGGIDYQMLLALLAGGLGAGYLVGRKRRKKKYKKKRKHKKK
jgi:hypothetical protein